MLFLFQCTACEEENSRKQGDLYCEACKTLRDVNPMLFDRLLKIIENKVESHYMKYVHIREED